MHYTAAILDVNMMQKSIIELWNEQISRMLPRVETVDSDVSDYEGWSGLFSSGQLTHDIFSRVATLPVKSFLVDSQHRQMDGIDIIKTMLRRVA